LLYGATGFYLPIGKLELGLADLNNASYLTYTLVIVEH